ncbi:zf-HC2 domain-containing protein [Halothiobacillus sp.]|uniref:zf-HC2 domain-containing protein n=1 Tax=Halothiobacillus sp. TaxID=1891311 RepID=UPI002AD58B85|nr:zf-HC2 domain-containing protein [Halothiobacillus sp.]
MLKCREATHLLSERLERDLSLGERMSLQVHTLICSGCRNFGHQMTALRVISQTYAAGTYEAEPSDGSDTPPTPPAGQAPNPDAGVGDIEEDPIPDQAADPHKKID